MDAKTKAGDRQDASHGWCPERCDRVARLSPPARLEDQALSGAGQSPGGDERRLRDELQDLPEMPAQGDGCLVHDVHRETD